MRSLDELKSALANYQINRDYRDEILGFRCCELAFTALEDNCYGVGALLCDGAGQILVEGRNEVFKNGFHSDRHAEMVVLNVFEGQFKTYGDRSQLTVMVSLEPCPMCFTRMLIAGIGRVVYLAEDRGGGMIHKQDKMSDLWRNLAQLQSQHRAEVTTVLSSIASELGQCRIDLLRQRLLAAIRA